MIISVLLKTINKANTFWKIQKNHEFAIKERTIMKIATLQEAKNILPDLINLAEEGEEVFIVRDNLPKVKLVVVEEQPKKRVFGQHRGQIWISPDFDEPLPDDFWGISDGKEKVAI
jgi:antitoxin (DNA-binding transcriptional repressor) of toxin-antitoxin stability system